jgi:hypothetical protein
MSLLAAIRKLWLCIAQRTHSDVEEEFRSTLDAYQEDLIRQGLSCSALENPVSDLSNELST